MKNVAPRNAQSNVTDSFVTVRSKRGEVIDLSPKDVNKEKEVSGLPFL